MLKLLAPIKEDISTKLNYYFGSTRRVPAVKTHTSHSRVSCSNPGCDDGCASLTSNRRNSTSGIFESKVDRMTWGFCVENEVRRAVNQPKICLDRLIGSQCTKIAETLPHGMTWWFLTSDRSSYKIHSHMTTVLQSAPWGALRPIRCRARCAWPKTCRLQSDNAGWLSAAFTQGDTSSNMVKTFENTSTAWNYVLRVDTA